MSKWSLECGPLDMNMKEIWSHKMEDHEEKDRLKVHVDFGQLFDQKLIVDQKLTVGHIYGFFV